MKTTNEMIAELVAKGFKLPEGMRPPEEGIAMEWYRYAEWSSVKGLGVWLPSWLPDQQAHDLIACAFARRVESMVDGARSLFNEATPCRPVVYTIGRSGFGTLMRMGDSEAAIKALWQAVCDAT